MPENSLAPHSDYEKQLREMNEALLITSVRLDEQTEALRRSREELEERVKERTAELVLANEKFKTEVEKRLEVEKHRIGILQRLTTAQEDERRRIAVEVHEQIGQQITALRFKLEEARSLSGDTQLTETISRAQEYARQIDVQTDFLAYELRPSALEDLGLRAALRDFVGHWSQHHNIAADFHPLNSERRPVGPDVNIHVYRIVQEALNNIAKHSSAKSVSVMLSFRDDVLSVIIEDNGVGFDAEAEKNAGTHRRGLGLTGMCERCVLIGGTITIESAPGEGTTIICRIPVTSEASPARATRA